MNIYEVTDLSTGKVEYVSAEKARDLKDYYSEVKVVALDPSEEVQVACYKEGRYHRLDGPAVVRSNGTEYWYEEGKLHKLDGPAIVYADGSTEWYKEGRYHRLGGPAVVRSNGNRCWYIEGKRHRLEGPAAVWANGNKYWYIEGTEYSAKKFNEYLRSH